MAEYAGVCDWCGDYTAVVSVVLERMVQSVGLEFATFGICATCREKKAGEKGLRYGPDDGAVCGGRASVPQVRGAAKE
jgi:hypothetical protein